jgi:hypothetical protein
LLPANDKAQRCRLGKSRLISCSSPAGYLLNNAMPGLAFLSVHFLETMLISRHFKCTRWKGINVLRIYPTTAHLNSHNPQFIIIIIDIHLTHHTYRLTFSLNSLSISSTQIIKPNQNIKNPNSLTDATLKISSHGLPLAKR